MITPILYCLLLINIRGKDKVSRRDDEQDERYSTSDGDQLLPSLLSSPSKEQLGEVADKVQVSRLLQGIHILGEETYDEVRSHHR